MKLSPSVLRAAFALGTALCTMVCATVCPALLRARHVGLRQVLVPDDAEQHAEARCARGTGLQHKDVLDDGARKRAPSLHDAVAHVAAIGPAPRILRQLAGDFGERFAGFHPRQPLALSNLPALRRCFCNSDERRSFPQIVIFGGG